MKKKNQKYLNIGSMKKIIKIDFKIRGNVG